MPTAPKQASKAQMKALKKLKQAQKEAAKEKVRESQRRQLAAVKRKLAPLEHKRLYSQLSRAEALQAMQLDRQRRRLQHQLGDNVMRSLRSDPRTTPTMPKRNRVRFVQGGLPSLGKR
ncbi:hypothetical protein [Micropruina glycogenica]|nr:hypothetical protein [Micropruina glycogenica]